MPTPGPAVTVAIVNDYEIVVAGLAAALAPYAERVRIVELDAGLAPTSDVDVVLYDTFGQAQGDRVDLGALSRFAAAKVVIFSWNVDEELVARSRALGVAGYVSKTGEATDLVEAIERVHRGEYVQILGDTTRDVGRWPGEEHGLSSRESEVLALITQGLSNAEICDQTYLSVNTLKTYVRTLYRKISVTRRSQAVLWGIEHGFRPDRVRREL